MRPGKIIWLWLILLWIIPDAAAQYVNIVCTGDTGLIYRVKGSPGSSFVWNVDGGAIVSDYDNSIKVNWGTTRGTYNIRVQEFSKFGCPAVPVTGKVLVSAPLIELGPDLEICQGESVEIKPEGTFYSYLWHDGSTGPDLLASGQGYIKVTVSDEYGCLRSDSLYLKVHPLPEIDLGRDTSLCGIETLDLDAGNDGVSFLWSTGESSRSITIDEGRQLIWVRVEDQYSCVNFDTIRISDCPIDERFKDMPTAFTPNGDGKNDVWRIPQLIPFPQAYVEIYDRWGVLIYKSDAGYSEPWNGFASDGREMPMDSYYFVINLGDGKSQPLAGTVTIIK